MTGTNTPRLSIDTHVAPRENHHVVGIPPPSPFTDYRQKTVEELYRDLSDDLLTLKLAPARLLSTRLSTLLNNQFHLMTTYAAAFSPFTTDPLSPTSHSPAHLLDSLPALLHSLTKPPLYPPRIEKLLLLRTIVIEFQRVSVARYFDRVESLVAHMLHELDNPTPVPSTSLRRSKSDAPLPTSKATSEPPQKKKHLRIWPFSRSKHSKPAKVERRGWDVSAVEREAQRFAEGELVRFVGLFRFVVGLTEGGVVDALVRALEPEKEVLEEAVRGSPVRAGF